MYRHAFYIILTLLSIVYATTPSIAQSIDHFTATVKYIQYPEIPLPEEMKDYRVVLSFDDQDLSAAERKTIAEKHLKLADRPINPNSPYLLLVQVGILNGETLEPEINSRDKKEGDKTVKVYSYAHRVRYWYPYTIRLTKPGSADDPIYAQNHAIESIYKTKIYPDEYTARKYFQDNKGAIIQEHAKCSPLRYQSKLQAIWNPPSAHWRKPPRYTTDISKTINGKNIPISI